MGGNSIVWRRGDEKGCFLSFFFERLLKLAIVCVVRYTICAEVFAYDLYSVIIMTLTK